MGAPKGRQNKRKKEEAEKERRRIEAENAKKVGIVTEASSSPSRMTQSALPLHPAPRPQPGPGLFPRPAPEQSLQPQLAIPPQPTRVGQPSLRHKSPEQQPPVASSEVDSSKSIAPLFSKHPQTFPAPNSSPNPTQSSQAHGETASVSSHIKEPDEDRPNAAKQAATPSDTRAPATGITTTTLLNQAKPRPGTEGTKLSVATNHFVASLQRLGVIYRYDIKITPAHTVQQRNGASVVTANPRNNPRKTRRLLALLLSQAPFVQAATDYVQRIVSLKPLTPRNDIAKSFVVDLLDEGETQRRPGDPPRNWDITVSPTAQGPILDVRGLLQFLESTAVCEDMAEILLSLNLIVSRRPLQSNSATLVGKDRLFANNAQNIHNLGQGLGAKIGFSRSVRALTDGAFLQINTSAAAFYCSGRMIELLDKWTNLGGIAFNAPAKRNHQDQHLRDLERFITGLRVRTTYGVARTSSVWGFAKATNPAGRPTADNVHFDQYDDQGQLVHQHISVRKYLWDVYSVESREKDALVINLGTANHPVSVPCDLIEVLSVNAYRHLLDANQTGEMVRFAGRRANANSVAIAGDGTTMFGVGVQDVDSLDRRFGIQVSHSMLKIHARRIDVPTLHYLTDTGNGEIVDRRPAGLKGRAASLRKAALVLPKDAFWTLKGRFFPKVSKAPRCAWIELHEGTATTLRQRNRWVQVLEDALVKYCSLDGARATLHGLLGRDSVQRFPRNLDILKQNFQQAKKNGFDIIFVLLQSKSASNYENLKRIADVDVGIHTICTVQTAGWKEGQKDNRGFGLPQVKNSWDFLGNEMLKVNLKMGGVNTCLALEGDRNAEIRRLLSPTTMIVGADVTHPGPGSMKDANSIAAVVASIEKTFSQYPASIRCQESKKEMIGVLDRMLEERLETGSTFNSLPGTAPGTGELPDQVLFFRDGVSEDQYQTIVDEGLPLIERAFKKIYGNRQLPHPKLLLVCIVKRVHTRFFPVKNPAVGRGLDPNIDPKTDNSWPGLVVDTNITYPRGYDFYMQSQRALQGTAKPAHYVVIKDDIKVSVDDLQKAIFWQCWTYQRSLKPISVRPAARFADRACNRARSYLRDFLVGNDLDTAMDRSENALNAWVAGVHPDLQDSTFYL